MYNINFADDWILTSDLWYYKQQLYQLSHNKWPFLHVFVFSLNNVFHKLEGKHTDHHHKGLPKIFCHDLKYYYVTPLKVQTVWPIWRNFGEILKAFVNYFRVYIVFDKILHIVLNFLCYWANFHCCKWPEIEKISQSCHTACRRPYRLSNRYHCVELFNFQLAIFSTF